jgi:two-component sensor histidine kinase
MAMVLHELATNAAKCGAPSTNKGRVSIRWEKRMNGQAPPVVTTDKAGYGTSTICDLTPYEFGGTVDFGRDTSLYTDVYACAHVSR